MLKDQFLNLLQVFQEDLIKKLKGFYKSIKQLINIFGLSVESLYLRQQQAQTPPQQGKQATNEN